MTTQHRVPAFAPLPASLPATVPFVGPNALERQNGRPFRARLGANENGFGAPPAAIAAMAEAAAQSWKYGDENAFDLKNALADQLDVASDRIIVGEGIDGLLGLLVRLMVAPGDAVVTSDGAYPTFNYHVAGFGGVLHKVPYRDDHEDPFALAAKAAEVGARLTYIANPDNPMGTWHDSATILQMLEILPEDGLLVLDEAYVEFAPEGTAPPMAVDDPRLIRFRTFSKAYGMAGVRIGYGIGHPDLIAGFHRIRNHFGVGPIAQAGARAALAERDWLSATLAKVARARARIGEIAAENGIQALESATNFVAVDTGRNGAFARALVAGLGEEGVFVRMPGVAPLDRCIRISVGPDDELDVLAEVLPRVLDRLRRS
ncbi:pyridoxal phosphate-dependent aminotransferase (plasmid) [Paracoccus sp. TK19116]|uniref:Pyridoxal phosphate-dependent aminotransferase n=1 Tax=Paracoccus albicereus TaxID=2922394 RepID=A0ABT1ML03_9RHOB|nr:pyridoxal phosphate-dependent aminotransferase [Paracoccus albicereus]MCQ0968983.1 pyridoxal phosphate-dependent aminotransferase [Paracoccus albicereus]